MTEGEADLGKLCFEDIDFVQEKDYGRPDKPPGVDDGFKEDEGFSHSVLKEQNTVGGRGEQCRAYL